MSLEAGISGRSRSAGVSYNGVGSYQLRAPSEPRTMQHFVSSQSGSTTAALALTQLPKYCHSLPMQEQSSLRSHEDLRVSQPHLRQKQQRPTMVANGVLPPRNPNPHPADWGQPVLTSEPAIRIQQATVAEGVLGASLSGVVSRALTQHTYPQAPVRMLQSSPPQPPKSDSLPPGIILKAVRDPKRRVISSSVRVEGRKRQPSRQNSAGLATACRESALSQDGSPAQRPDLGAQAATTVGTRTPQSGEGTSSPSSSTRSHRRRNTTSAGRRPDSRISDNSPKTSCGQGSAGARDLAGSPSRRDVENQGSPKSFGGMASGWVASLASIPGTKKKTPKREIQLLRSVFAGRPPVLFFDYEPDCGASPKDSSRRLDEEERCREGFGGSLPKMWFCHEKTKDCHEYNAVLNTLRLAGFYRTTTSSSKWALFWGTHPSPEMLRTFHPFQKANHFPASWQLGRKDLLWKNVYRMKRQWPQDFNIVPVTFVLPDDFQSWVTAREQTPSALWIYKPANSSCGRGIKLLNSNSAPMADKKLSQKTGVIQKYIDRPMKIDGYKFDLRIYVVVTSFDPLKVYLNSEGLVRLATERYARPTSDNLDHRTMHLTNYSVNKHSESYVKNQDGSSGSGCVTAPPTGDDESGDEDTGECDQEAPIKVGGTPDDIEDEDGEGAEDADDDGSKSLPSTSATAGNGVSASKWSFEQLRDYCERVDQDYDLMMLRIKDLIIKTLLSVEAPIVNTCHQGASYSTCGAATSQLGPNQTCFEIYGFDVMFDDRLKPWLLEVNIFPSISSSSPFDKRVKTMLVADSLTLAGFMPFDHDLVDKAMKEEHLKRLQGLHQKHSSLVTRSHTINTISSATLKSLGGAEWQLILDTYDEYMRRGQLERIYPTLEAVDRYSGFFSTQRYSNMVIARWLQEGGESCFQTEGQSELPQWLPQVVSEVAC